MIFKANKTFVKNFKKLNFDQIYSKGCYRQNLNKL